MHCHVSCIPHVDRSNALQPWDLFRGRRTRFKGGSMTNDGLPMKTLFG